MRTLTAQAILQKLETGGEITTAALWFAVMEATGEINDGDVGPRVYGRLQSTLKRLQEEGLIRRLRYGVYVKAERPAA